MGLPVTDILYEWTHVLSGLFCLFPSLGIMFVRFICVIAKTNTSFIFLWPNNIILYGHSTFVYSFIVDVHLDCLCLTIMNNAAMNIHVQAFTWTDVFNSLKYTPRRGMLRSYGNSVFSCLKNCQIVFHIR